MKADDTTNDTDDSDEELGAIIYQSSRTAKKFREEAERIKQSESCAPSSKKTSKNTKLKRKISPAPSISTKCARRKCSIDECTNNVQQGGVCIRHGATIGEEEKHV